MKKLILIICMLSLLNSLKAQVTTSPGIPTANEAVTITFNATGTGLAGYTGDVYAHTGVTTAGVGKWQHVIGTWGDNTKQPKLTRVAPNLYELAITPSINQFYSVLANEKITEICIVFRSADKSKQTSDIFISVYEVGLAVSITSPEIQPYFVDASSNFNIHVESTAATEITVKKDGISTAFVPGSLNSFDYPVTVEASGTHEIIVEATDGSKSVSDNFVYVVRSTPSVEPLPEGAKDGINYNDVNSVTLVLHAPFKNSVYVFGSFNNWQPVAMKKTVADVNDLETRYWVTLSGLTSGQEYIFQYILDDTLKIAEPYAEKISDPWNDKYITTTIYPGLIAYPEGKTEGIASIFQTAQTPYNWKVTNFTPPKKEDLVIYELLVRDFVAKANYQTLIDTIGYFKRLGINAIELMPINEFDGNSSWGYNPAFYFAPDKAYGTKNKLKEFIDTCHSNGIAVIQDLVLNHSYGQSPFVQLYFDKSTGKTTPQNLWYNVNSNFQNTSLQWGYDFNHDSPYTRSLVDSINSYWMSEYKVDGYRFDFTKGFSNTPYGPTDYGSAYDASRIYNLERMSDEIWKRKSNAFVIFEHLADNSEETVLANHGIMLWGNMNNNYCQAAMGYSDNSDISATLYTQKGWSQPNLVSYMESHDEERVMYKVITFGKASSNYNTKLKVNALKRVEMDATFFFAFPGPKMIWQFGELGYDISIDQGGRVDPKPIKWNYYNDQERLHLFQVFSALIKLKKEQDIFESGTISIDVTGVKKRMNLTGTDLNITIVGNFDVIGASIDPNFQQSGTWYDYFSGNPIQVSNTHATLAMAPGEYHIYTSVQLEKPDITADVKNIQSENEQIGLKVYPNPAINNAQIEFSLNKNTEDADISIYDISGKKISTLYQGCLSKGEQKFKWDLNNSNGRKVSSGMYLIKLKAGMQVGNSVILVK